jgi:hypothetical protein
MQLLRSDAVTPQTWSIAVTLLVTLQKAHVTWQRYVPAQLLLINACGA